MAQRSCAFQVSARHGCFQGLGHPWKVFVKDPQQLAKEFFIVVDSLAQRCLIPHRLSQGTMGLLHGFTSRLVAASRGLSEYDSENLGPIDKFGNSSQNIGVCTVLALAKSLGACGAQLRRDRRQQCKANASLN